MAQRFPQDRFDAIPADLARVGAHRAPQRPGRNWPWVVWSLVAVVVLVLAGFVYIRILDGNVQINDPGLPNSSSTPAPTVAPTVSPKVQITVLNGTTESSLANKAAAALRAAGWKNVTPANASVSNLTKTTIYYAAASDKGIALGVAKTIPKAALVVSSAYKATGDVVTVVLGSDYTG